MDTRTDWIDTTSLNSMFYTKEETIASVQSNFNFRRNYSAEGKSVRIDKLYTEQVLVQDHTNPLNENKTDRKLHVTMDSALKIGSYVEYEDEFWLTVSKIKNVDGAYKSAQIQQCNYSLKFQNGTITILEEPCIILTQSDALSGEDTGNIITIPDTQRVVYIQYNANTAKLVESKRLYIDKLCDKPKVFHISKIDRVCYMQGNNGLWKLTCDEDATVGATDRPDLMVADYVSTAPYIPPTPTTVGTSFIVNTKVPPVIYDATNSPKQIKVGGFAVPFDCVFKDTLGNAVTGISPKWGLVMSDDLKDKITFDNSHQAEFPNRVYVKVIADNSLIGKQFTLTLVDQDDLYGVCNLLVEVTSYT